MQKIELLAPAKDYKTAICAINYGADALYVAADKFGARKGADNSLADIKKIIDYAHLFNVKVYVTLNTILDDFELIECEKLIWELYNIKTDAIIIQDFGILSLNLPPIVLHASTQCDNRTIEKIKFLQEVGFKRVVLPRELSLDDIEKINKNTDIELEHFIAGALCVCYSGQCYMSHYIGKRSANRGCCAQACRKKYTLITKSGKTIAKNKYLLNLKDNNLSSHLDKLVSSGVKSFKIEGRLKDLNYVKNNVLFYHNLLKKYPRQSHGNVTYDFEPDINKTFNRGFCDDYLFNKKDNIYNFSTPKSTGEFIGEVASISSDNFVIKTAKEINPQDGLCFILNGDLSGCLVNKAEKVKSGFKIYPNKISFLKNLKFKEKIFRNIDVKFNKILQNSKTVRKLPVKFIVFKDKIELFDSFKNKIEYSFDEVEIANNKEKMKDNFIKCLSKTSDSPYLPTKIEFKTEKIPFIPIGEINAIRRQLFEGLSSLILDKYKTKKQKPINIAKYPVSQGDYRLNVHNKKAQEFYEMCDCKVLEKSFESTNIKGKNKELMRMRHCLKRAFLNCNSKEELFLVDESFSRPIVFPLKFDCKNCEMIVVEP